MTRDKPKTLPTSSPFYLSLNADPGIVLGTCKLEGDQNYNTWSKAILNALKAKNKKGFILGTIKEPKSESLEGENWGPVNYMIMSWIFNSIDTKLQSSITFPGTAKELWDDLKYTYSRGNELQEYQLRKKENLVSQKGMAITDYFQALELIWGELDDLDPPLFCECSKCTCNFGG